MSWGLRRINVFKFCQWYTLSWLQNLKMKTKNPNDSERKIFKVTGIRMEPATLYSRSNGILWTTKLLIKYGDILKIFLDNQDLLFSKWVIRGCYIVIEGIKARKRRHGFRRQWIQFRSSVKENHRLIKVKPKIQPIQSGVRWWKEFRRYSGGKKERSHRLEYIDCLTEKIEVLDDMKARRQGKNETLGGKFLYEKFTIKKYIKSKIAC